MAAAIVVSTEHLEVVDDDGAVLASYDYFQPPAEVVDGLTAYLGEPVDTEFEGYKEAPPSTYHDWGGLRLIDTEPPASPPATPEHWVRITGPDANGVALRAFDGSAVGGPITAVEGEISDSTNASTTGIVYRMVRIGIVPIESTPNEGDRNFAVAIDGPLEADVIESMHAPSANFGP